MTTLDEARKAYAEAKVWVSDVYKTWGWAIEEKLVVPADAYIAELEAALAEREALLSEVREACHGALSSPEAHRGNYTFMEYRPYEEILDIINPPTPEHEAAMQAEMDGWLAYLKSFQVEAGQQDLLGYQAWCTQQALAAQPPTPTDDGDEQFTETDYK